MSAPAVKCFALPFAAPIVWHPAGDRPDNGVNVLVYCDESDEVCPAFWHDGTDCWRHSIGGRRLEGVSMWALIPHPTDGVCIAPELLERMTQHGAQACLDGERIEDAFSPLLNHFLRLGLDAFDRERDEETQELF